MKNVTGKNHFVNRELSWLSFNSRVLDQAFDKSNPLLERLKFMAIFSNNLDEFFMVRVASLMQAFEARITEKDPAGLNPEEQLDKIRSRVKLLVRKQYSYFRSIILPELAAEGIYLLNYSDLSDAEKERLKSVFEKDIMPVLTPIGFDPTHPFPVINNKAIEIAVKVRKQEVEDPLYGFVEVPTGISRFVKVNYDKPGKAYILLENLIYENINMLFSGCKVTDAFPFRITKDMDFEVEDVEDSDLLTYMENKLKSSRNRKAIRLEVPKHINSGNYEWLVEKLKLPEDTIYGIEGPLNLADFFEFISINARDNIVDKKIIPQQIPVLEEEGSIFDIIKQHGSILLFHPYERFDYVVDLLNSAAEDPDVLAIKQTLYRVSGDSPVVRALQKAAENGKQVTVIVELKARFDERRNISWAKRLELSGAHVIYGMAGLKIHCKALLIVRKEEGIIRRYLHLSTGNYNDTTAKIYTDAGMLTDNPNLCSDIAALFNVMTGYSEPPEWKKIAVAPFDLREKFVSLIEREARNSTKHNPGRIIVKINALEDKGIIEHLYRAAYAGVKIDLIVRGLCCLKPGIETRNINIISIVDRYLEHSRIYYFGNSGNPEFYLASADWMPRNLDRRIEVLFPVESKYDKDILMNILELQMTDSFKGRRMDSNGNYPKPKERDVETRSQIRMYDLLNRFRPIQQGSGRIKVFEKREE